MFEWLKKYRLKNHISKQSCFVFPIIPKEELIDGKYYQTFHFKKKEHTGLLLDSFIEKIYFEEAIWNKDKDCFVVFSQIISYEDFRPIKRVYEKNKGYNWGICSYNPNDVNPLDLEELKKITFDLNDDNTQSDTVWENLIKYFEDRGF